MTPAAPFDAIKRRRDHDRAVVEFASGGDFFKCAMAASIAERLIPINRRFGLALDMGCHTGWPGEALAGEMVSCDISDAMLDRAQGLRVQASEEALPFAPASFDLIVSAGSLHQVNDLPGCLLQCCSLLRPDGLFVAAVPGEDMLAPLRRALIEAEAKITGGAAQRLLPMIDVRSAGALLQRAGFAMPVVDVEHVDVSWTDPLAMLRDLRAMADGNILASRAPLRRDVLLEACSILMKRHAGADGRLHLRLSWLMLAGWAPAPGQPKPLRPGSGKVSLAAALESGAKPGPDQR